MTRQAPNHDPSTEPIWWGRRDSRAVRVLIVDDDSEVRDTLAEFFVDEGYCVATAANGDDALRILRDEAAELPHVIILDLLMPVLGGADLYALMQRDPRLARVPVIVATSDPTHAPRGLPTFGKPTSLERLLGAVEQACRAA